MSHEPQNPFTEALCQEISALRARAEAAEQRRAEDEKACLEYAEQRDAQQARAEAAEALAERRGKVLWSLIENFEAHPDLELDGNGASTLQAEARAALQEWEGKP